MVEATAALTWLDTNKALLPSGIVAVAEVEILRLVVTTQSQGQGNPPVLMGAYRHVIKTVPPPFPPTAPDVYPLTHMVMFATDFGRTPVTGFDASLWTTELQRMLTLCAGDLDLTAELLICTVCLKLWGAWADTALTNWHTAWLALDRTLTQLNMANVYHRIVTGGILLALHNM